MKIRVTYAGTEYDVEKFGIADFVAFERQFGVSAADFENPDKTRFEYLCFLVYRSLRKKGIPGLPPYGEDFLDLVEEIDVETEDEEEQAPLGQEASTG